MLSAHSVILTPVLSTLKERQEWTLFLFLMSRNGQRNPFESSHRSPDVKAFWASARNDSSSFIRADDETIPDMQTSPLHNGYATKKYDSPKYKFR